MVRSFFPPRRFSWLATGSMVVLLAAGCSHKRQVAYAPPPPTLAPAEPEPGSPRPAAPESGSPGPLVAPTLSADEAFVASHQPISSETGLASWYGPPYHNRLGANGEIYNENQLSAAHRTLPMGSLIQVVNVKTGQSAVMRVTDRGPFVAGRILDLSLAAAKAIGTWRAGVSEVRINVYSTPKPMDVGGRWCVQIGAFSHAGAAKHLESQLDREYPGANVIEFQGPTGFWVRIRPQGDDRSVAVEIAHRLRPSEGVAWLVRLD